MGIRSALAPLPPADELHRQEIERVQREIAPDRFSAWPYAAVERHDRSHGHVNDTEQKRPDVAVGGEHRIDDSCQCPDTGQQQHEMPGSRLLDLENIGHHDRHQHPHQYKQIQRGVEFLFILHLLLYSIHCEYVAQVLPCRERPRGPRPEPTQYAARCRSVSEAASPSAPPPP